jgi:hypothetical protein
MTGPCYGCNRIIIHGRSIVIILLGGVCNHLNYLMGSMCFLIRVVELLGSDCCSLYRKRLEQHL